MENESASYIRALWFTIGYITAILIEELSEVIGDMLANRPSQGFVVSENGSTSKAGETVSELVKEPTHDE